VDSPAIRPLLLVVDDDLRSARMLAQLLREDGFDVEVAGDGAAAVSRLTKAPMPDALVTDFRMPNLDGVTLARVARALRPNMPLVIVTGYPELVNDLALSSGGGFGSRPPVVLAKPLSYPELATALPFTSQELEP
jgi:two-component system response regulator MprA